MQRLRCVHASRIQDYIFSRQVKGFGPLNEGTVELWDALIAVNLIHTTALLMNPCLESSCCHFSHALKWLVLFLSIGDICLEGGVPHDGAKANHHPFFLI